MDKSALKLIKNQYTIYGNIHLPFLWEKSTQFKSINQHWLSVSSESVWNHNRIHNLLVSFSWLFHAKFQLYNIYLSYEISKEFQSLLKSLEWHFLPTTKYMLCKNQSTKPNLVLAPQNPILPQIIPRFVPK